MRKILLEEVFIGACVRVFQSSSSVLSPLRVIGINSGGLLTLKPLFVDVGDSVITSSVDAVYGVPIDADLLRRLGFVEAYRDNVWFYLVGGIRLTASLRQRHGAVECRRVAMTGDVCCWNEDIRYLHELQRWWTDKALLVCGTRLTFGGRKEGDGDGRKVFA